MLVVSEVKVQTSPFASRQRRYPFEVIDRTSLADIEVGPVIR